VRGPNTTFFYFPERVHRSVWGCGSVRSSGLWPTHHTPRWDGAAGQLPSHLKNMLYAVLPAREYARPRTTPCSQLAARWGRTSSREPATAAWLARGIMPSHPMATSSRGWVSSTQLAEQRKEETRRAKAANAAALAAEMVAREQVSKRAIYSAASGSSGRYHIARALACTCSDCALCRADRERPGETLCWALHAGGSGACAQERDGRGHVDQSGAGGTAVQEAQEGEEGQKAQEKAQAQAQERQGASEGTSVLQQQRQRG
jgi:hypothetical protein